MLKVLKQLALLGGMSKPIKVRSGDVSELTDVSPQTASRRLQALEADELISRKIEKDGQWISLTEEGIELLKWEYLMYKKIFEGFRGTVEISGTLFAGMGEGRYYVNQGGYKTQFKDKLGFIPFPGTLNLHITKESIGYIERLYSHDGIQISGFSNEDRSFGDVKCFRAEISDKNCAVILPERSHYPDSTLEVISPEYLRESLGLRDGDKVCVKVILE